MLLYVLASFAGPALFPYPPPTPAFGLRSSRLLARRRLTLVLRESWRRAAVTAAVQWRCTSRLFGAPSTVAVVVPDLAATGISSD